MSNTRSLVRQEKIVHLLMELERASIQELAAQLGVSSWTVRRELTQLEDRCIVRRFHGGVELVDASVAEPNDFDRSVTREQAAKQRIGQAAARLLLADQSIVLGGGTTTTEVARYLKHRKHLCIMTNSLNIALELSRNPDIQVTCTGGDASSTFYSLIGHVAERTLQAHYFDVAVIGVSGISVDAGLTVSSQANAALLRIMIEHSRKCIVVADHSKFDKVCFAHLAPLDCITTLVTDCHPAPALAEKLASLPVRVLVADNNCH
ncbi:MAG: DeoR/GlpR transcriptional regulator [Chloroflexi bacterium]|nr:DeoR/GlpR transcriptional regulator [Chloroflexota bacterium]